MKGTTKYSFLIAIRENKITTTPEDPGYNLENESFHLKRIIDISISVLENQMQNFKNTLYKKYQVDIIKFKKGIVEKKKKNMDVWKEAQDLIHG